MVMLEHKCARAWPRVPCFFSAQHSWHKLGQRHNPTICQRSFAFSFTFFHCKVPHRPSHTCAHTDTSGGGGSLNYKDRELTAVNNQSKRKELQTAKPAASFEQTHMNRQVKLTANGGNTLAGRAASTVWHQLSNCLTSAHNITIMVRQEKLYIPHPCSVCCSQPELFYMWDGKNGLELTRKIR